MAEIKDGILRGERLSEGVPDWFRLHAVIDADGNAKLDAKGLTGNPKFSVGGAQKGTPYYWTAPAHFEGSRGKGRRTQLRTCDVSFVTR